MITSIWMKWLLGGLSLGAIAYIGLCLSLYFAQKRLIYVPSRQISYTPEEIGLDYEDVWLPLLTSEETVERIHGWWIPGEKEEQEVLLYFHGNGGNISSNLNPIKHFHQLGFSVFILDYRGYGRSDGKFPDEAQLYKDSQRAWDYLVQKREIKPENIFLFGHSLGGAIALDLAVRKPHAAALIVQSSFTSMQDMVEQRKLYRLFPIPLILNQRFDSLAKLRLLRVPLMLIHGTEDRTVYPAMSQTLFNQAQVEKKLYFVPLAGHNNVSSVGDEQYKQEIAEFRDLVRKNQRKLVFNKS